MTTVLESLAGPVKLPVVVQRIIASYLRHPAADSATRIVGFDGNRWRLIETPPFFTELEGLYRLLWDCYENISYYGDDRNPHRAVLSCGRLVSHFVDNCPIATAYQTTVCEIIAECRQVGHRARCEIAEEEGHDPDEVGPYSLRELFAFYHSALRGPVSH